MSLKCFRGHEIIGLMLCIDFIDFIDFIFSTP